MPNEAFEPTATRRLNFALDIKKSMSKKPSLLAGRAPCPCCGYPTLESDADYEICELCNWEDDGQSDSDADEVRGGPNADYSLTEARKNFTRYGVMYAPGRDMRITGGDSTLETETKGLLIQAFERLTLNSGNRDSLENEILRLEQILRDETARQVKEYESKQGSLK